MTDDAPEITATERALMREVLLTSYAQLIGPASDILTNLMHRGLVEWRWNAGIPIYYVTEAGRAAVTHGERVADTKEG